MAKFCKHCGSPLEEDMIFCDNCGARQRVNPAQPAESTSDAPAHTIHPTQADISTPPTAAYSVPQPTYGYNSQPAQPYGQAPVQPEPKKSKKGLIIGLIAGAVVLIGAAVFFIFFNPFIGGSSTDDSLVSVVKIMADSVYSEDYSAYDLMEVLYEYNYAPDESTKKAIKEAVTETVDDRYQYQEIYNEINGDFKTDVVIAEKNTLTGDDYDNFVKDLNESVDYPTGSIQQAIKAKIKVTFTGIDNGTEVTKEYDTVYFVKVDGKWYAAVSGNPFTGGDIPFDDVLIAIVKSEASSIYSKNYSADSFLKNLYEYNYAPDEAAKKQLKETAKRTVDNGSMYKYVYENYGSEYEIDAVIIEKKALTGDDYNDFIKGLNESVKYPTDTVRQIIRAKVKVVYRIVDKYSESQETRPMYFIKADGKWYAAMYDNPFSAVASSDDSPAAVMNTMVNAVYGKDIAIDSFLESLYEYSFAKVDETTKETAKQAIIEWLEDASEYKRVHEELGGIFKTEATIEEKKVLTGDEYKSFIKGLSDNFGVSTDKIQQIIEAKVKVVCKGINTDTEQEDRACYYFIKAGGKWYVSLLSANL